MIVPLALLALSRAEEVLAKDAASMQMLTDRWVDQIFSHALKAWPLHHADLDSTTFGQSRSLAIPKTRLMTPNSPAFRGTHLPRNQGRSAAVPAEARASRAAAAAEAEANVEDESPRHWLPRAAALTRRGALLGAAAATVVASWAQSPPSARAAATAVAPAPAPPNDVIPMRDVKYKSFSLQAPMGYDELPEAPQTLPGVFLLLVNSGGGLPGNTIALFKSPIASIDLERYKSKSKEPVSMTDIGSAEEVGNAVVEVEKGELISAVERKDASGQLFYQLDYKRNILGLQRHVLVSLTLTNGVFYTLVVDMDQKVYDEGEEGNALRRAASSLVTNQPDLPATPAKGAEKKAPESKKGAR